MTWAIRTEELAKEYRNKVWALQDFTISFDMGTFVALVGPNGAGKTTLIHLLCGLLTPTKGRIALNIDAPSELGWCSQHQTIDWFLNVWENTLLGAKLAGVANADEAVENALKLVGLSDLRLRQPDELSGGQQQRLKLARALVHDPKILLVDEPTTGLDIASAENILMDLRRRANNGALVLASSHDLDLLERYCDQVLYLESGRIVAFMERGSRSSKSEVFEYDRPRRSR